MSDAYYHAFRVTVYAGDCLDVLADLPDASVHAVVTDPPYGLEFMGKDWDKFGGGKRAKPGLGERTTEWVSNRGWNEMRCRSCGHLSHGGSPCRCEKPDFARADDRWSLFQEWCLRWTAECLRVLKPGGHLLAFGGPRTWHRLAVAVEDAGFEVRDSMAWLYASGFPKSLDVSKAIDKARRRDYVLAAVELGLEVPGNNLHDWTKAEHSPGDAWWERFKAHLSPEQWGTLERRVVGQREKTDSYGPAAGNTVYGSGPDHAGIQVITAAATREAATWQGWGTALKPAFEPIVVARKPLDGTVAATVLEHGTGALNIDGCRVAGESTRRTNTAVMGYHGGNLAPLTGSDTGRWPSNVVLTHAATPDGVDLCADGCVAGCPVTELDQQSGLTKSSTDPDRFNGRRKFTSTAYAQDAHTQQMSSGKAVVYGDSGGASRFFPVFRFEAKAPAAERPRVDGVAHPTVKPLALMRWLVRLVTPPGGVVLDPFLGSGTTAQAARAEGFECIGIERDESYLPLIRARLDAGGDGDLFGGAA